MYIMQVGKLYNSLCTPAQLYFVLSVISILALLMQNCSFQSGKKWLMSSFRSDLNI